LNSVFISSLDESVRSKLTDALVEPNTSRKVYIASREELSSFNYFEGNTLKAQTDSGNNGVYWTRTPAGESSVYCYNTAGESAIFGAAESRCVRPVIVLPCDICVENADTGSGMGYRLLDGMGGIYIFKNGEWSECEL